MPNLTRQDWGCDPIPYTVVLKSTRTGEVKTMEVNAFDRLDAVIWCEKTLGEDEWKALPPNSSA